ncbi:hypothetical protein EMA8858_03547 [Emticicia aquatica]|uniref:Uncharacterized protein n=1 Tax=Emticicia aquatica TaxID=1681835 RepID=A0ABN8F028_9BACT|nr:hypothetical protein [Emticicia aquatica]CAH0997414.1 hypothetical protein EMA8858_03547 [Emticicia aquatica]
MERPKNVEERGIRIARLLELIESTENILKLHQSQEKPSFLAVNQYTDLLAEHRAELGKLLKPYGFTLRLPKTKANKVA